MTENKNDPLLLILDPDTRALVGQCKGPTGDGRCPRVAEGVPVPCSGRRIVPAQGTGIEGWSITVVDDDVTQCPLAWAIPNDLQQR